ncbi:thiamine pyrophosphate-dependent dehydrogenase E1 component subunit alpha [Companilactobacillus allii]|uniref:2-oxoisovalerate dehydrogenase subunit alpha n=1 Tax=Companilactobacillus allii TaxID=1847728 RepID=A0A1P8Q6C4_9LACO|nr:thiamine pyrophosphate-dependent dehydrogenase E1 component subunit alpha [Companilactobacillus allii]APX73410.1 pyruvate dehydrogenase (acetyl-transferring) E1 component subunit alpha [Companilactobacillus allii]USQ67825.1 thiamine pyrophosphate-dependent dehydrogenase E1 component subunit alpha [Companilactobacillus allii]
MANEPIVDFEAIKNDLTNVPKPIQVLNESAEVTDQEVFDSFSDDDLVEFMKKMVWERALHEQTMNFSRQGRMGFYAPTEGEEASEMGTVLAMKKQDYLLPAYRDVPQLIQHGATVTEAYLWSRGHVIGNKFKARSLMPQIIIGAAYNEAAGVAMGIKKNKEEDAIAFTYTGDGGTSQGDSYEGMNFAGAFQVPALFIVQNNGFAISTPRKKQTAAPTLAQKAVAAGIPSVQVDGMDILACYAVAKAARDYITAGNGPVMIETLTYRYGAHSSAGDDPKRYRTKEDTQPWFDKDPLIRLRKVLEDKGLWSDEQEDKMVEEYKASFKDSIKEADKVAPDKVSDMLKRTFEIPTPEMRKEIEKFVEKESK